jgi:hypothetical protein
MMSYRVTELAKQAEKLADKKYNTDKSTGYSREHWFQQIFAQLIVEECISVMGKKGLKDHFEMEP